MWTNLHKKYLKYDKINLGFFLSGGASVEFKHIGEAWKSKLQLPFHLGIYNETRVCVCKVKT